VLKGWADLKVEVCDVGLTSSKETLGTWDGEKGLLERLTPPLLDAAVPLLKALELAEN
jgi:hypothetical protein